MIPRKTETYNIIFSALCHITESQSFLRAIHHSITSNHFLRSHFLVMKMDFFHMSETCSRRRRELFFFFTCNELSISFYIYIFFFRVRQIKRLIEISGREKKSYFTCNIFFSEKKSPVQMIRNLKVYKVQNFIYFCEAFL